MAIIESEIDRLNNLVEDFICYSRPVRLKREMSDIHTVIGEAITVFSMNSRVGDDIKVQSFFGSDVPPLYIDGNRIKQVLLNILNNALQAIPDGGAITIRTLCKSAEREVEVSVKDTGTGIAKDVLPKIFEPFFSTKDRGMGIGLNIVHNIVKAHGGYMLFSSTGKNNTEVQLNFPMDTAAVSAGKEHAAGTPAVSVLE